MASSALISGFELFYVVLKCVVITDKLDEIELRSSFMSFVFMFLGRLISVRSMMANQFPAGHAEFSLLLFIVISKSFHFAFIAF